MIDLLQHNARWYEIWLALLGFGAACGMTRLLWVAVARLLAVIDSRQNGALRSSSYSAVVMYSGFWIIAWSVALGMLGLCALPDHDHTGLAPLESLIYTGTLAAFLLIEIVIIVFGAILDWLNRELARHIAEDLAAARAAGIPDILPGGRRSYDPAGREQLPPDEAA